MLAGAIATVVTFTVLTYAFISLFTGAGIFVAWLLAWSVGMMTANIVRSKPPVKGELLNGVVFALLVAALSLAFFNEWLWWNWWTP